MVYFEDSREGETTFKYDLTLHLPLFDTVQTGGTFKVFDVGYTVKSPWTTTPYSPVAGIDPFSLHAIPVVSDRRLPAGLEAGDLARGTSRWADASPLRHPVADPI